MKILHSYKVYRPDVEGGVPSAIATLSRLATDGYQHHVLAARRQGIGREYEVDGIPVKAVGSFGDVFSTPLAPTFPIRLLQRSKDVDVLVHHAPFPLADIVCPFIAKRVALIVYWHADIMRYSALKQFVRPAIFRTLRRADRIIVSDPSIIRASEFLPEFSEKCTAIPFGTDVDYWWSCSPSEQTLAAQLRHQHPRMILSVGRLVSYKGLSVLLRSLKSMDAHLVLVGEGSLKNDLQQEVHREGLAGKVTFSGRLSTSDIKAYLHAARVLAFPSVTSAEAFGIVQIEAMAAGLPIVNTSLPTAVPVIARHDREALTVPPNDSKALATALSRVLDDADLRERLSQAGRLRVKTEFDQNVYVSRVQHIFSSEAERKRELQA